MESLPLERMAGFLPTIFTLWLNRLQNSSTVQFMRCLLVTLGLIVGKHGGDIVVETFDRWEAFGEESFQLK